MHNTKKLLGLIGYPLEHSFSERYFNEKFAKLGYNFIEYQNFPLEEIDDLPMLLDLFPEICGFNVTIPYKKQIMKYLIGISPEAREVGAVNTVAVVRDGDVWELFGYNTDIYGFEQTLKPLLEPHHKKALILGTGGAAQAVAYVLKKLNIPYKFVSRNKTDQNTLLYSDLDEQIMTEYTIIINATPLGMYPKINLYPPIPYQFITPKHLLYDLIYNPKMTKFLQFGQNKGAKTYNGLKMLYLQADKAWEIFEKYGCFNL